MPGRKTASEAPSEPPLLPAMACHVHAVYRGMPIAMRLKSEANELFKAGKYEDAESMYQAGLMALEIGRFQPPPDCEV